MTPTTQPVEPSREALKATEALKAEYQIGNSSRFCDEAPDWDAAEDADIARIIDSSFAELRRESADMAALLSQMLVLARHDGTLRNESMLADAIRFELKKYRAMAATTPEAGRGK